VIVALDLRGTEKQAKLDSEEDAEILKIISFSDLQGINEKVQSSRKDTQPSPETNPGQSLSQI
jgi:hypothetical protein